MSHINKHWDRQLERGLPDSRLAGTGRDRKTVVRARMLWEVVFCANCGAEGGLVTAEWAAHVFYLCDDCSKLGKVEGAQL